MAAKGHSTFLRSSELEPHYQMQFRVIPRTPHLESYPSAENTDFIFSPIFLKFYVKGLSYLIKLMQKTPIKLKEMFIQSLKKSVQNIVYEKYV